MLKPWRLESIIYKSDTKDAKCAELWWVGVHVVINTFGAWDTEHFVLSHAALL